MQKTSADIGRPLSLRRMGNGVASFLEIPRSKLLFCSFYLDIDNLSEVIARVSTILKLFHG